LPSIRIAPLKKIVTYSLLIIVFFAFNCNSVSYYLHLWNNSIVLSQDSDCEKEKPESEKSDEKDEKKEFSEYFFSNKLFSLSISYRLPYAKRTNQMYTSSEYTNTIYCPPDTIFV
jgi:hypothetical protein